MPRYDPVWVDIVLWRYGEKLSCRVAFDSEQLGRALRSSRNDEDALCIQVAAAMRKSYQSEKRSHLARSWPGRIEFSEILPSIHRSLKLADEQAQDEVLEAEYWQDAPPPVDSILFDH